MFQAMRFAWLLLAVFCNAYAGIDSTHEKTLDNGLKVIVKEDHRAPVVISQVWYRVGSAQEHNGITGVSHLLEHMMFKGTEKYSADKFTATLAEIGARDNAFTSRDYTAYYQLMGSPHLEVSFRLESDRMVNLVLSQEDFISERNVAKEERRWRTDDNPNARVYEQLQATAFVSSPYHHPVIGWMDDLNHLELEDLDTWYRRWYAPNNATLVVVGDVEPEAVFAQADEHFGVLERRPIRESKPRLEFLQTGPRRVTVKAIARLPYIMLGYKVPSLANAGQDWEPYALAVLSGVLDGGRSARLSKHLVREMELVASAGSGYNMLARYPTLFLFEATPATGHSVEEVEQALYAQIRELQEALVSDRELARVKAQVIAGEVYQQDQIQGQASLIGRLETAGLDWRLMHDYRARIDAITAEQVREVARTYLVEEGLTVGILEPQSETVRPGKAAQPVGLPPLH